MAKVSVDDFVTSLKEWTVVDVMNAIKAIETEFGVTAAAPVAVAAAPAAGGGAGAAAPEAEQTEFQVVLTSPGDAKIGVIKVVREITGLGLKEAKDLVDQAPKPVKQGINREEAEGVLKKLNNAGAAQHRGGQRRGPRGRHGAGLDPARCRDRRPIARSHAGQPAGLPQEGH